MVAEVTTPPLDLEVLRPPKTDWTPDNPDLVEGAAGVGLGHLRLYHLTGEPTHLAVARRCVPPALSLPSSALISSRPAVDGRVGRAHGMAGTADLALAIAEQSGSVTDTAVAAECVQDLATTILLHAGRPDDHPVFVPPNEDTRSISWANGASGLLGFFRRLIEHGGPTALPVVDRPNRTS